MSSSESHPIIIVTGANGGVGFGICQRLLSNFLGLEQPVDSLPQALATPGDTLPCQYAPCTSLTIIMACRTKKAGEGAREKLLKKLDEDIKYRSKTGAPEQRTRYNKFRETLRLDIVPLELSHSSSVLDFCDMVQQRYPYISHLIFNAGNAPWIGIDWPAAVISVITNLVKAVTYPRFKLQQVGVLSEEGFGFTWMCNVFGHFILARRLLPALENSPWPARVLWTTSIDVEEDLASFDFDDWQLVRTKRPYETTKYQISLVAKTLDIASASSGKPVRHFVTHPGVTGTNIMSEYLGPIREFLMVMAFYIARVLLGSQNHPLAWISGAIAAVHVCLVNLALLCTPEEPTMYASRATRFGKAYVGKSDVPMWSEYREKGEGLVKRMDGLLESLLMQRKLGEMTNRKLN